MTAKALSANLIHANGAESLSSRPMYLGSALPEPPQALARRGGPHSFRTGELLIHADHQASSLHVLLAGQVGVFATDLRERETAYGARPAGEDLGEMSLHGDPSAVSVLATVPTMRAIVERPSLLAHIAERPEFALELLAKRCS